MESAVHLACFFAALPRPPGVIIFKEIYVQAYPIARYHKQCGNVSQDVRFDLFTRANDTGVGNVIMDRLQLDDVGALEASNFDRRRATVLYLHGFGESSVGLSSLAVRDAFLAHGGYNVIMADYVRITASPWYDTAVANSVPIGRHVGKFIDFLAANGMPLRSLHVVGISLGAQVAAVVGASVQAGRLARITGLDPAAPGFVNWAASRRLNKASARFVDVIHTDVTTFGVNSSVGHADFYPNGGVAPQPGCRVPKVLQRRGSPIEIVFCSHLQSYVFFVKSLLDAAAFPATPCASWKKFQRHECPHRGVDAKRRRQVFMGIATPKWARGNYYLSTMPVKLKNASTDSNTV